MVRRFFKLMDKECEKQVDILDKAVRLAEDMIKKPDANKIGELIEATEKTKSYLMEFEKMQVQDAIFQLRHPRIIGKPSESELVGSAGRIERQLILPLMITSFRCSRGA